MNYEIYRIIHLAGIMMIFSGLGGVIGLRLTGPDLAPRGRRLFAITHGLGLLITLIAGFGMAARLGFMASMPLWLWCKIAIWLVLGGGLVLAKRRGQIAGPLLTFFLVLGATAAWLAIIKPF